MFCRFLFALDVGFAGPKFLTKSGALLYSVTQMSESRQFLITRLLRIPQYHNDRRSISVQARVDTSSSSIPLDTYNLGLARLVQLFRFQKRILNRFVYVLFRAAGECDVMTVLASLSFF
jgi:hypothetical protein